MRVALLSEKADIQYCPDEVDPNHLVHFVKEMGFGAELLPETDEKQQGRLEITVKQAIRANSAYSFYLSD